MKTINEKTRIGEIIDEYPLAAEVLFDAGMGCVGCSASQAESIEDACAVHGLDVDTLLKAINEKISKEAYL